MMLFVTLGLVAVIIVMQVIHYNERKAWRGGLKPPLQGRSYAGKHRVSRHKVLTDRWRKRS